MLPRFQPSNQKFDGLITTHPPPAGPKPTLPLQTIQPPPNKMAATRRHRSHDDDTDTEFSHIFATPPRDGVVALYTTTLLQESPGPYSDSPPVYLVTPYRLFQPSPDIPAFCVPSPARLADNQEILLVSAAESGGPPRRRGLDNYGSLWEPPTHHYHPASGATRTVFYTGRWHFTGRALASMYCATLIPILQFTEGTLRAPWPRPGPDSLLPITAGSPEVLRAWERRWEPDTWNADIAREFDEPEPEPEAPILWPALPAPRSRPRMTGGGAAQPTIAPPPPVTRTTTLPSPVSRPSGTNSHALPSSERLPAFILEAYIRDAISRHTTCPITMEPLTTPSQVAVTNCYHLFDATALATWRASSGEDKCPTCRATL